MVKKNLFLYTFIILIVILIGLFVFDFFYRTLYYKNHIKECKTKDTFCGIQIINISIPNDYIPKLKDIGNKFGKRIEILKKHQKNIPSKTLIEKMPDIENWYNSLAPIVSNYIGEKVIALDNSIQTRLSLVVYEKEGDYIDWHFDTNHYTGRFFTLLVPITLEPSCGNYQYKNEDERDIDIEINKNQAILFEGDKIFHRGKALCRDDYRVILSLTFVTSRDMNMWNYTMHKIKEFGIFGK